MVNQDFNSDPDDHRYQEDDGYDDQEQENTLSLDQLVHQAALKVGKSAYDSGKINLEFEEEYTLVKNIWDQLQCLAHKAWVREAVIISAVMILKSGLWIAYRIAKKQGMEIVNL